MSYLRNEMKDEFGIRTLQEKILEIAVYIDQFCRQHGIQYFLMGGSALGAVRHQGFIPWDDDLDIFMKPEDYALFRKLFFEQGDRERFYLQEQFPVQGMVASAKLRLNGSAYIESATKDWNIHQGIFVDIFLLHNASDSKLGRIRQCLAAKYILAKGQSLKKIRYHGIKRVVTGCLRLLPKRAFGKCALKTLYSCNKKQTKNVCHFMGKAFFEEGIYSAEYFRKPCRCAFENVELNVPSNTHEYLQGRFGDYMKLPPRESIKMAQHAWKWDTEKDFSKYVNPNRDFSDEKYLV